MTFITSLNIHRLHRCACNPRCDKLSFWASVAKWRISPSRAALSVWVPFYSARPIVCCWVTSR